MKTTEENHLTWFDGYVKREDRENLHGHRGIVIWFTGLSASGKSTIAHIVENKLFEMGCTTYVFDGDNVRHGLCGDLAFSPEDRVENIRRIGEMVNLYVDAGIIAIAAFISPYRSDRRRIRDLVGDDRFFEIHVDCPPEVCASRDTKGLYEKAKAGIVKNFTGISAPYEPPEDPALIIRSYEEDAESSASAVVTLIKQSGVLLSTDMQGR